MKRALFIVNPQLDFMPGGSLAVPFGDKIVPIINKFSGRFNIVIVSRDRHPEDHKSFTSNNGANFHPDLQLYGAPIFTKGENKSEHPFSGFVGVNDDGISIEKYLKDAGVDEVYVVGLSGDYCVKDTALDCSVFFKTYFIVDATRFIGEMTPTVEDLAENGVMIINSNDLDIFLSDDKFHTSDEKEQSGIVHQVVYDEISLEREYTILCHQTSQY